MGLDMRIYLDKETDRTVAELTVQEMKKAWRMYFLAMNQSLPATFDAALLLKNESQLDFSKLLELNNKQASALGEGLQS